MRRRPLLGAVVVAIVGVGSLGGCGRGIATAPAGSDPTTPHPMRTPSAEPTTTPPSSPTQAITPSLADLIEIDALRIHLEALQAIADESGGSRATGTEGFDASVRYVSQRLVAAGYRSHLEAFEVAGVPTSNLLVERQGTGDGILMLGAHLDSIVGGPGINDNGSGVAALLVIAERVVELRSPELTVRFAFWAAEEGGPFGSAIHVTELSAEERNRIAAYINFDMLASPNAIRLVYDEVGAALGSEALTAAFASAFEEAGLAWEPIDLEGASDHGPFTAAGIPTGGLFSGGIEPVTEAQAARFGAVAGQPADPCSHAACDTIDNVDLSTLAEMVGAIARVVQALAFEEGPP